MRRTSTAALFVAMTLVATNWVAAQVELTGAWHQELASYVEELDPEPLLPEASPEPEPMELTPVPNFELASLHGTGLLMDDGGKGGSKDGGGCQCNQCCPGWFVTADYLNWRVERNDLAFAIFDPAGAGVPAAGSPVMSLELGGQSGFRIAGGRRTASGWEIGGAYTFLRADDSQTFAPGAAGVLAVQSSPSTGLTNANTVTATSDFDYDVVDLEAGHWFHASDSVSLQVLGGLRYASIDHAFQVNYNGGAFVNGMIDVPTEIQAFGGRLGGQAHWNVSDRFSLFAKSSVSLLKAEVESSRREVNGGATLINASRPADQMMPGVDLSVGFRWFSGSWSIAAGYEWVNWFNAVNPLEFSDSFNGGTLTPIGRDLGLHGIYVNSTVSW